MSTAGTWTLASRIADAPGVTARRAASLRALGVETVADLVRYLPVRHELERAESEIAALVAGGVGSARGEVTATRPVLRGKRRFEAVMTDDTERLDLVWFNQAYLRDRIKPGMRIRVQGKAQRHGPGLQMVNPTWEALSDAGAEPAARDEHLRPVYPATEDLSSREIERIVAGVLPGALAMIEDHLPDEFVKRHAMPALAEANRMVHAPRDLAEARAGLRRLAYDELLLMQLGLRMRRARLDATLRAPALRWSETIDARIRARLPFTLTKGQESAVREIVADLRREAPANRLVQGDVGSGKTVVALYAMLMAAASGRQAALMAPTALLAEQHFASLSALLGGSRVRLALLTGASAGEERAALLRRIGEGDVDIVVGTHAILTETVRFASLAVAVIDEQHRFGVHQRARLREKADDAGSAPHVLVMTATPIPRTLSLTVFGDLDVSVIKGLPPGRKPVATRVVGPEKAPDVYAFVRDRVAKGEQAYVVTPTIEGEAAGQSGAAGVRETLERLEAGPLAGLRLAPMHGRLKRETREKVMERFRAGEIDVLVATTVIEVGVDVPNASVMVVEGAERFGLAQLHQLRGRVGRGSGKAVCALIAQPTTEDGAARLAVIASTTDGFVLAEKDLEIRGPGEAIGARQSGAAPFRAAEFPRDTQLLLMARRDAEAWVRRSPDLAGPGEGLLRRRVMKAHGKELGLAGVA